MLLVAAGQRITRLLAGKCRGRAPGSLMLTSPAAATVLQGSSRQHTVEKQLELRKAINYAASLV
jgi:hypothetical protein